MLEQRSVAGCWRCDLRSPGVVEGGVFTGSWVRGVMTAGLAVVRSASAVVVVLVMMTGGRVGALAVGRVVLAVVWSGRRSSSMMRVCRPPPCTSMLERVCSLESTQ
ncbi:hypothetical protein CRUP_011673 [Coryphaenoides rupestris]|nr:hypothetical protein CRUP_011673 [Coryphaenoides rupestris]